MHGRPRHERQHGARARPGGADEPLGARLLVPRQLPDGAESVQRRQHARHELRHRLLGRPRLRRRLRRLPCLRHLEADAEAGLGRALLWPAGRPVGVRHRPRPQGRHAGAVGRQRAHRARLRRWPGGQDPGHGPLSGGRLGGPTRLRHLQPATAGADRGRVPGLRLAHQHAAPQPAWPLDVRAQLELSARRRADLRAAGSPGGAGGQPRRRAGHRGAVPQPGGGRGADGAADRLSG